MKTKIQQKCIARSFEQLFAKVDSVFSEFNTFLIETRTHDSECEAQQLADLMSSYRQKTSVFMKNMKQENQ